MGRFLRVLGLTIGSFMVMMTHSASAGVKAVPVTLDRAHKNAVSVGVSIGTPYLKDASFWGLSADYSRVLSADWSTSASVNYDRETERRDTQPDKIVDAYTAVWVINYSLSSRWSLSTGLAQEFMNDDNAESELRFGLGDVSTGISAGFSPTNSVGISFSWEWNITESEPSISVDFSYRWQF